MRAPVGYFSTAALAIGGSLFAALVMKSETAAYVASFAVAFVLAIVLLFLTLVVI